MVIWMQLLLKVFLMMEDSNMEYWSEIEEDKSSEESKMSLILNRGWRLGKKIMIAGVAISSAPIVLPPLMIFSTLGFAFAVPFSFVFVSYAFTQKLMSKLLSRPEPPLMLEYKIDEEEDDDVGIDENIEEFMDDEKKEFVKDTKETLEMRIELIGDEKEEEAGEGFVVEEEEEPIKEDMEGVREEERRDDTWFDNYVEEEEKPVDEYYLDYIEEEELEGGVKGVIGEFGDERIDETLEEEELEGGVEGVMEEFGDEQKMVSVNVNDDEESRGMENGVKFIEDEKIEEENPVSETNGVVEESTDEGNVDIMVEEEEIPVQYMKGMIGEEIEVEKPLEVTVENIEEGKEPMRETEGMVEENRDEGFLDKNIEGDEKPVAEMQQIAGEISDEQNVNDVGQEENYIVIEEEKPVVDINGVVEEERRDNGTYVGNLVVKEENLDNNEEVKPMNEARRVMEETGDDENADKSKEEEIPIEETMKNAKESKGPEIVDRAVNEGEKPVVEMSAMMEDRRDEENVDKMVETKGVLDERTDKGIADSMVEEEKKPIVQTEKRVPPSKTEDAREIADESGLHLFDEENADADHYISAINEPHQDEVPPTIAPYDSPQSIGVLDNQDHSKHGAAVEEHPSDNLRKEIADSVAHPVSLEIAEFKSTKGVSEDEKNTIPSKEVLYSEEKIWEQIDAMRKIVGYKASIQATFIEELKALYVFTGVEPPLAFKDPTDLAEINGKLRLLMSIVGVK
ncbi:hypothetical protein BVC80_605g4 [Macleaya cordata]|uniref:Uncharacterized protein n=1 Tax=Macleaya cordata TaxID=56857 RepID=A0A200R0G7_MACCD|nr:hypothetical protein BVC80_605g4 [Macleaya cordata]